MPTTPRGTALARVLVAVVLFATIAGAAGCAGTPRTKPIGAASPAGATTSPGAVTPIAQPVASVPPTTPPMTPPTPGQSTLPRTLPGGGNPAGGRPPVINHGPRTGNEVALTFDADMTSGMLDKLARGQAHSYANLAIIDMLEVRHVPATFFLTGMWVRRYPQLTQRLAANPSFELANHSWSHRGFTANCYTLSQLPRAEMAAEVRRTFETIAGYGGRQTRYFRFPGGCFTTATLAALSGVDMTVIGWDVVSGDPKATAWRPIVRAVLDNVRPGSIVVLHITEDNAQMTDEALPYILDGLVAKGLRPVCLSDLLR